MLRLWIAPAAAVAAASAVHPWESFQSSPAEGAAAGVRRFSHSEHTSLQDGSGVHVSWDVDVDPESILALDWERQQHNGVALVSCGRDRLTLHVPREHTARLPRWQFVTFSSDLHGCRHLAGRDLYHKVLQVAERSSAGPSEKVILATEELSKASEVFHRCRYNLTLTPPPVGGRRLMDSRKLKDEHHDAWNTSFAPPMPFELPFNQSIPRFASESFMLHARRLVLKAGAQLHYSSTKNKDGHLHMEDFWGKVDFDVDIDADIIMHLKVAAPDTHKGIPSVTDTEMFDPVALCEKIKVPLGPVPLTILPQIDALRLKVKRIGRLEGSFNALLNAKLVGFILMQFNERSGMNVRVNATVVKGVVKPPVFIFIDEDFSLDASLVANVSVMPFFMVGMNPKFGISVGLAPGPRCAYRELDVHVNASLDLEVTSPIDLIQFSHKFPRRGTRGLLGDLLPEKVCNKGFCNGTRPGCHDGEVSTLTINIHTIAIVANRTLKKEAVPTGLRDAIGYGLSGFPDEVKVIRAFLLTQTGEYQREEFRHTVGKPLGEAVHKLGTLFLHQFSKGLSAQPHQDHARLLTDGGDDEEVDAFVVQLTKTRFEITDEVLQRLLDLGAFRIYDGRESFLGGVRITSIGLLPREPGQQQLWEEAPVGTPEERVGTNIAVVTSTLTALALVGLAVACVRRKPRQYGLVVAEDAA